MDCRKERGHVHFSTSVDSTTHRVCRRFDFLFFAARSFYIVVSSTDSAYAP